MLPTIARQIRVGRLAVNDRCVKYRWNPTVTPVRVTT